MLLFVLAAALLPFAAATKLPPGFGKILLSQTSDCPNVTDPDCLSGTTWTHFTSNFDDLAVNTVVGPYTNIIFSGFTVASPPLIDGHPYKNHLGPTTAPNFARAPPANSSFLPYITAEPNQFAKIKWFDWGCFSYDPNPNAPPENAVPVPCNLTVQSSVSGFAAPYASLSFKPSGPWRSNLAFANLTKIDRDFIADTTVFYAQGTAGAPLILYIDSIVGVNYTVNS